MLYAPLFWLNKIVLKLAMDWEHIFLLYARLKFLKIRTSSNLQNIKNSFRHNSSFSYSHKVFCLKIFKKIYQKVFTNLKFYITIITCIGVLYFLIINICKQ